MPAPMDKVPVGERWSSARRDRDRFRSELRCDSDHAEWYDVTAMSNNTSSSESSDSTETYEAPSLSVIGTPTELTMGPASGTRKN